MAIASAKSDEPLFFATTTTNCNIPRCANNSCVAEFDADESLSDCEGRKKRIKTLLTNTHACNIANAESNGDGSDAKTDDSIEAKSSIIALNTVSCSITSSNFESTCGIAEDFDKTHSSIGNNEKSIHENRSSSDRWRNNFDCIDSPTNEAISRNISTSTSAPTYSTSDALGRMRPVPSVATRVCSSVLIKGSDIVDGAVDYCNVPSILAPMVKISVLPFRLKCLEYGADLVYSEEVIASKLAQCTRVFDPRFGKNSTHCLYIHDVRKSKQPSNHIQRSSLSYSTGKSGAASLVFSTDTARETGKLVLQLGAADNVTAVKAAELVVKDVSAIDINMGCPKSFSVKGGMGAALLHKPEIASDILKTLQRNIPRQISAKIRIVSDKGARSIGGIAKDVKQLYSKTVDFAKLCEKSGVSAIAIHAREKHERPSHTAHWDIFPIIRSAISVPLIANGDFLTRRDVVRFKETLGANVVNGFMYARGAMWDPTIFTETEYDKNEVTRELMEQCVKYGAPYQSSKWLLQSIVAQSNDKRLKEGVHKSVSTMDLCKCVSIDSWYKQQQLPPHYNTLSYFQTILT